MAPLVTYNDVTFWNCQFFTRQLLLPSSCIWSSTSLGLHHRNSVIIINKLCCFFAFSTAPDPNDFCSQWIARFPFFFFFLMCHDKNSKMTTPLRSRHLNLIFFNKMLIWNRRGRSGRLSLYKPHVLNRRTNRVLYFLLQSTSNFTFFLTFHQSSNWKWCTLAWFMILYAKQG